MTTPLVPIASQRALQRQSARALTHSLTAPTRASRRRGTLLATLLFSAIAGWAGFVPLASGVVAPARVIVEGERKLVQHPTGGVVAAILVTDGARVAMGQPLLVLRDTDAEAAADVLGSQVDGLIAEEAALLAELGDRAEVKFAAELMARAAEPRVAALVATQRSALAAARAGRDARRRELNERESQLGAEAAAARARRASRVSQLTLVEDELKALSPLLKKGLVTRPRILALERSATESRGEVAAIGEDLQRLEASRRQVVIARERIDVDARATASERLRVLRTELAGALEKLKAARATLARTTVASPAAGTVVGSSVATVGGVVTRGQTLMEIVPDTSRLVIEARIKPKDADDVRAELPVTVRFAGLNERRQVYLDGHLQDVSADALADQRTGESYFRAVAAVDRAAFAKAGGVTLRPGLPAEMLIRTGERTALQYLLEPLELGGFKALRN